MRTRARLVVCALVLLLGSAGCSRYASTRVFLHGEVEDEDGKAIPFAVVRLNDFETLADERGHYRALFLAECLDGVIGAQGIQTPEVQAFATGYPSVRLGFHLDSIKLIGGGSCPADTSKYLRLILPRPQITGP